MWRFANRLLGLRLAQLCFEIVQNTQVHVNLSRSNIFKKIEEGANNFLETMNKPSFDNEAE